MTLPSTLGRLSDHAEVRGPRPGCRPGSGPTSAAVRSSSRRVRLGKWRKKLSPTSRQSTLALRFWFTAVLTRGGDLVLEEQREDQEQNQDEAEQAAQDGEDAFHRYRRVLKRVISRSVSEVAPADAHMQISNGRLISALARSG